MAEDTPHPVDDTLGSTDYEVPEWLSLDDDEEIQWIGEPILLSLVGTAVWGVILTVFLIGFLLLLFLPLAWLGLKNTDYVVTNKALYVKTGIMGTNIESVNLDKIQNTEYSQSFWGKQFGYGSIDVSTAGSSGAEITLESIENAREVRELINSLGTQYSAGTRGAPTDSGEPSETAAGDDGLDELIDELRATRQALERVDRHLSDESKTLADDPSIDEDRSA